MNGNGRNAGTFRDPAFMENRDAPVNRWVPWIAGYTSGPSVVLDPFAGVGTTLVEADFAGHDAIGFDRSASLITVERGKLAR